MLYYLTLGRELLLDMWSVSAHCITWNIRFFFTLATHGNMLKIDIYILCISITVLTFQKSFRIESRFRVPTGIAVNCLVFTCSFTTQSINLLKTLENNLFLHFIMPMAGYCLFNAITTYNINGITRDHLPFNYQCAHCLVFEMALSILKRSI